MNFIKLIVLVLLLQVTNLFGETGNSIKLFSDKALTTSLKQLIIEDTLFIKYSYADTLKSAYMIRIANKFYSTEIPCKKAQGTNEYIFYSGLNSFNPEKEAYVNLNVCLVLKDSVVDKKNIRLIYTPLELLSVTRQVTTEANIGDKLYIKNNTQNNYEGLNIYLNQVPIGKLKLEGQEGNLYSFFIKEGLPNNDSLSKVFNLEHKESYKFALGIGANYEDIKVVEAKFKLMLDENKGWRKHFSGFSLLIILIMIFYVLFKNKSSILRDNSEATEYPPFSLSRSQMAFWTIIIIVSFFVVWYYTGNLINITPDVLALLGISAGTTVGANLIDKNDINDPKITRHQDCDHSGNFLLDILSDSNGLSIHRFQNVIFTFAIGCYFLFEVFKGFKIPDLDTNLILLMGISSGTYLAIKKGENDTNQPNGNRGRATVVTITTETPTPPVQPENNPNTPVV